MIVICYSVGTRSLQLSASCMCKRLLGSPAAICTIPCRQQPPLSIKAAALPL